MKFSIGLKLWAGFISILLVLLVVGAISYQSIVKLMTAAEWRAHTYQVLDKNSDLLSSLKDAETGQRGYLLTGEDHYLDPYRAALNNIDGNFQALRKLTADNQAQQRRLETLWPLITEKLNELKDIIELRRTKGLAAAQKEVLTDLGKKTMDEIRAVVQAMEDEENVLLQVRNAEMQTNAESTYRVIILGMLIACGLVVAAGLLLTWHISRPLKDITDIADQIAAGDLSIDLALNHRTDEIGALKRAFTRMVHSLQDMAGTAKQIAAGNLMMQVKPQSDKDALGNAFAAMVSNLRKLTLQIQEGVNVLTSSSSEILATTTQVASGAAETATAVNQTTATVEEIKQAVQLANQKAKHVSDSAQKTAQASQSGRQAVGEMIGGMGRIREQTSSTAQSIVKLSEQSRAIGEIIATVKDLAEQSNLLAVNASIEASKAGEQGKGFAVVAQEIKSLAEQSRQATVQVRMILGEIQAATEIAVMATDMSGKAVELGAQQSDAAGASIQMLGESIMEAAHAAMQIAASSQQQMVGMDQVALAMENIKQASSQNMAGTRQAETAAQGLHELGLKLKQLVETYQV
jgi:methyl-accepting chemotaxis protein